MQKLRKNSPVAGVDLNLAMQWLKTGAEPLTFLEAVCAKTAAISEISNASMCEIVESSELGNTLADSANLAFQSMVDSFRDLLKEQKTYTVYLQSEIVSPYREFMLKHAQLRDKLISEAKSMFSSLAETRQRTETTRREYMEAARKSYVAGKSLRTLIRNIESGNQTYRSMIEPKTSNFGVVSIELRIDEVLDLEAKCRDAMDKYRKTVEWANAESARLGKAYHEAQEAVLELEKDRVSFFKIMLHKYAKFMKHFAGSRLRASKKLRNASGRISVDDNVKALSNNSTGKKTRGMFAAVRFEEFQPDEYEMRAINLVGRRRSQERRRTRRRPSLVAQCRVQAKWRRTAWICRWNMKRFLFCRMRRWRWTSRGS